MSWDGVSNWLGTKGYTEWGDIRLVICHQWGSIGLHPWPCALQHLINNQDTGLEGILSLLMTLNWEELSTL